MGRRRIETGHRLPGRELKDWLNYGGPAMIYATEYELIAELLYNHLHRCRSSECICHELRRRPAIDAVIRALHTEKLRARERQSTAEGRLEEP